MGCCNEPVNTLAGIPPDPTQHVNYARGMVLGVDDFTQEFAWLSGRVRWLARDAVGYGTLSGLRVFADTAGADGPRLQVTPGSALVPSGHQVCVAATQCCVVNRWLARAENAAVVLRLLHGGSATASPPLSPPAPAPGETGTISLFLTLCWADCLTRPVPVPGEPCRSEDELMAPSRVADDYRLELREQAPLQTEEDALRDFVRWLRNSVQVVDASPPPAPDPAGWREVLAQAAGAWLDPAAASPPLSPPSPLPASPPPSAAPGDYLVDLSPPGLAVARADLGAFLRTALRFWVTELRPLWMALRCHRVQQADADCLLLARVGFEVGWVGGPAGGAWQVTGSPPALQVDETTRPLLADLRLLQEALLEGGWAAGGAPPPTAPAPPAPPEPPPSGTPRLAVVDTATDLTLTAAHGVVVCAGGQTITLPAADAFSRGLQFTVKSVASASTVAAAGTDAIDGPTATPGQVPASGARTFVSDGNGRWHVIGSAG